MSSWFIGLVAGVAAVLAIFGAYFGGQFIFWTETLVPRWAQKHGYHVLHKQAVQMPFCIQPLYWVVVADRSGRRRAGWVRFTFFTDEATEYWTK